MSRGRMLAVALGAAALLFVLVAFVARRSINSVARTAIEYYGSSVTRTTVLVEEVDIQLSRGTGVVKKLTVANPPGFSGRPVFQIQGARVVLDTASIGKNPIVIKELAIIGPKLTLEMNLRGESNIEAIRRNIEQSHRRPLDPSGNDGGFDVRFIIERLTVEQGEIEIDPELVDGERMVVPLEDFEEEDIGEPSGGASGREIAIAVAKALVQNVDPAVAGGQIEQAIANRVGGKLGRRLGGSLGDAVREMGGALQDFVGR